MTDAIERLLSSDGPVAVVLHERLRPVAGKSGVIFPPTFADIGYNIDELRGGKRVAIDSVGSQANRMEEAFLHGDYARLVPQITIVAGKEVEKAVNLLRAAHRLADAAVRFSGLAQEAEQAFAAYRDRGDATPIARLSPMSLVFGMWDSRGTQVKVPRALGVTIYADDVEVLTRSAQLVPAFDSEDVAGVAQEALEKTEKDSWADIGLAHVPSSRTHGGVICHGDIVREGVLNLVALRGVKGDSAQGSVTLQRYVLGLALVAATLPGPYNLRQGCLLVRDGAEGLRVRTVEIDGKKDTLALTHQQALDYATTAAEAFGVAPDRTVEFSPEKARKAMDEAKAKKGKKKGAK